MRAIRSLTFYQSQLRNGWKSDHLYMKSLQQSQAGSTYVGGPRVNSGCTRAFFLGCIVSALLSNAARKAVLLCAALI